MLKNKLAVGFWLLAVGFWLVFDSHL